MSYKKLYELRQSLSEYVSRNEILDLVRELTGEPLTVIKSELDITKVRGYFLPIDSNHRWDKVFGGYNLVVVARNNNRCWSRLVIFKESMHLFDSELEQTSTPEDMENLINEFVAGNPQTSFMMISEEKALWRALSLIMREEDRIKYGKLRKSEKITDLEIAKQFRMPVQYIPHIFSSSYKIIIGAILD